MRTYDDLFNQVMDIAQDDERIRGVGIQGSRSQMNSRVDEFSDLDIVFLVKDFRTFIDDPRWVDCFGERLITQYPEDWYTLPFDLSTTTRYVYLMQFKDGLRLDLTLVSTEDKQPDRLRLKILMDKDGTLSEKQIQPERYEMDLPDEKAFRDTVNEFWWLTLYVNKGICRKELHTAWTFYRALLEQTDRCLVWLLHTQNKDAGKFMGKLDTVLDETSYQRYLSLYPKMDLNDISDKEFLIMDAFELISNQLADALGFGFPTEDTAGIRALILNRLASSKLT